MIGERLSLTDGRRVGEGLGHQPPLETMNEEGQRMFGKHFASMYEGSMIGAGAVVFAVWGYVIARQEPDRTVGSQVRLNPRLLAAILGEEEQDVRQAIEYLCAPDAASTTKTEDGRRLKKLGEFDYQVVNGAKYQAIRDSEQRREQNREAQRRFREKAGTATRKRARPVSSARSRQFERAQENGATDEELSKFTDPPTQKGPDELLG